MLTVEVRRQGTSMWQAEHQPNLPARRAGNGFAEEAGRFFVQIQAVIRDPSRADLLIVTD